MVELGESFKAFQFQQGLDRIVAAYDAAVKALLTSSEVARRMAAEYEASDRDDAEYDEDGCLIHSTRHALEYAEGEIHQSAISVREAFIMATFHYWEKSASVWTGNHGQRVGFDRLLAESEKHYDASPELRNLNSLNNLLKHGNPSLAVNLVKERPDWFNDTQVSDAKSTLSIGDAVVREAFEIVRSSGPAYR